MQAQARGVVVLDGPGSTLGLRMAPGFHVSSTYDTFPDGSDNIALGGFEPVNMIAGSDVVFCMNMASHKTILQCMSALVVLTESFVASLTVVVPFMPCATMERVDREGVVATANTLAKMLSGLPNTVPIRVMHYDLHTLQNRFYYSAPAVADLRSLVCSFFGTVAKKFDFVVFPDAGALKRYGTALADHWPKKHIAACTKVRKGDERIITVNTGHDLTGLRVLVIDDLTRTGGTLVRCAEALKKLGADQVSAFCTHVAGSQEQLLKLCESALDCFYTTDTVEHVARLISEHKFFKVLGVAGWVWEDIVRLPRSEHVPLYKPSARTAEKVAEKAQALKQAHPAEKPLSFLLCSTSPHKAKALRLAVGRVFPDVKFDITLQKTKSGVSNQPMTRLETVQGCANRLFHGFSSVAGQRASYIVSVESGLDDNHADVACVKILSRATTTTTTAFSACVPFPVPAIFAFKACKAPEKHVIADFIKGCKDRTDPHVHLCGVGRAELLAQAMVIAFGQLGLKS